MTRLTLPYPIHYPYLSRLLALCAACRACVRTAHKEPGLLRRSCAGPPRQRTGRTGRTGSTGLRHKWRCASAEHGVAGARRGLGHAALLMQRRPGAQAVSAALGALASVGAVMHGREALTPLGLHLAALPVDVRCGRPRDGGGCCSSCERHCCCVACAGCRRQVASAHPHTHDKRLIIRFGCVERSTCW